MTVRKEGGFKLPPSPELYETTVAPNISFVTATVTVATTFLSSVAKVGCHGLNLTCIPTGDEKTVD